MEEMTTMMTMMTMTANGPARLRVLADARLPRWGA